MVEPTKMSLRTSFSFLVWFCIQVKKSQTMCVCVCVWSGGQNMWNCLHLKFVEWMNCMYIFFLSPVLWVKCSAFLGGLSEVWLTILFFFQIGSLKRYIFAAIMNLLSLESLFFSWNVKTSKIVRMENWLENYDNNK